MEGYLRFDDQQTVDDQQTNISSPLTSTPVWLREQWFSGTSLEDPKFSNLNRLGAKSEKIFKDLSLLISVSVKN